MPTKTKKQPKTKSKPVAVVLSDLHAHPWAAFAQRDGAQNSRLRRTLTVLEDSLRRAMELDVPWLFAGDIVHTAGFALNVVLAELVAVLRKFPTVPKLAVWGNHDARGVGGRILEAQTVWATLVPAVHDLTLLDPSIYDDLVELNGLTFSGAGAQPSMESFVYAPPSDIGIYHGTVLGSVGPNGYVFPEGLDPLELLRRHRVVIVGDIHHPQQIEAPAGQAILIPGSPEHHNFGDSGEHGWWVLSMREAPGLPEGEPAVEFVPGGSPEFRTVEFPRQVKNDQHFYRVRSMPAGAELPANATVIAPTPTTVATRDLLSGKQGEEILSAWLNSEPPDPAPGPTSDWPLAYIEVGKELLAAQEQRQLRPLRLARLHLHNFCSYGDQLFEIRPGTWLVLGRGRDFPSNGAGKTTLFEALFWVLFGRTTKGLSGDEVVRWGAEDCKVTAVLQDDVRGGGLVVSRSRGKNSRLEVADENGPWEAASVNEMTEKLSRSLGLTPELFQALGYFSQEQLLLFASASDGERKDMLADLIGLSAYQAAATAAGKKLNELALEEQRVGATRAAVERLVMSEQSRLEGVEARSAVWDEERKIRAAKARADLEDFLAKLPAARTDLMRLAKAELTAGLTKRQTDLKAREATLANQVQMTRPLATEEQLATARTQFQEATARVVTIKTELDGYKRQLDDVHERLKTWGDQLAAGVCPTCQQPVSAGQRDECLAPDLNRAAELERAIEGRAEQQAQAVQEAAKLKGAVARAEVGVKSAREADEQYHQLQRVRADLEHTAQEMSALEGTAASHVDGVLKEKRAEMVAEATRIKGEKNPCTVEILATHERIAAAQSQVTEQAEDFERLKWDQGVYSYWQHGFSKQGIQSLLVDEVAGMFNRARGTIFPALTQGVYDVQFSTMSQTKAGEWRERSEFQVLEHGQPVLYAALSGGQRRRIDVGVMLVLVKAVSEWMRVPGVLGLLVLDEVFGFLDASGAEGLMEALREVQAQIPTVYAVSHDPQLQALFPEVVVVEQDAQGVSRIVEGA